MLLAAVVGLGDVVSVAAGVAVGGWWGQAPVADVLAAVLIEVQRLWA